MHIHVHACTHNKCTTYPNLEVSYVTFLDCANISNSESVLSDLDPATAAVVVPGPTAEINYK